MKKIYIILSYSNTVIAKVIRLFTHYKYSHVSISLDKNLNKMYSFGRKKVNNPFNGGFIIEKKSGLFFQKFSNTKCLVLELKVSSRKYRKLSKILKNYEANIDIYRYDIIGLILKLFKIKIIRKNYFVCTEFVGDLLNKTNIYNFGNRIIKPIDFTMIPNIKTIYSGKYLDYRGQV